MLANLKALYTTEPARVIAATVAIVAFLAAKLGIAIDQSSLGAAVGLALLILLGGEGVRAKVSPATGPVGPDNDASLPAAVFDAPPIRED